MMGSSTRSGLTSLANVLELISDQAKTKAMIKELQEATAAHDESEKKAKAALSKSEAKAKEVAKRETDVAAKDAEVTSNAEALLRAQTNFTTAKQAFEAKQALDTAAMKKAKEDHGAALKSHQSTVKQTTEELDRRKAEMDQAQRALDERASRLAAAEAELAAGRENLASRLAQLKSLAG